MPLEVRTLAVTEVEPNVRAFAEAVTAKPTVGDRVRSPKIIAPAARAPHVPPKPVKSTLFAVCVDVPKKVRA